MGKCKLRKEEIMTSLEAEGRASSGRSLPVMPSHCAKPCLESEQDCESGSRWEGHVEQRDSMSKCPDVTNERGRKQVTWSVRVCAGVRQTGSWKVEAGLQDQAGEDLWGVSGKLLT